MTVERHEAIVVGSGLAGLTVALSLGPVSTLVISKSERFESGSTPWAQGGVAFPRDEADKPQHVADTMASGSGLSDEAATKFLIENADDARFWLESVGVAFDRDKEGDYLWGREGAHSARRILHVGADATGAGLARTLVGKATQSPHITLRSRCFAIRLVEHGLVCWDGERGLILLQSQTIVLAGGGLGQLFGATTAPEEATGDTMALAIEAGASFRDLEMVQFHPTALSERAAGSPSLALLTEALRGEGAVIVTADSQGAAIRDLDVSHPMGSLGPRDVLSRAIFRRLNAGYPVWLDARLVEKCTERFPNVSRLCADRGLNPERDLLPIVPAVHYTMGGLEVDLRGRTNLKGVWSVGESSRTGVHGANRLASNSLLECVVWGRAAARDILSQKVSQESKETASTDILVGLGSWKLPGAAFARTIKARVQKIMDQAAGPIRTEESLRRGIDDLALVQGIWDREASRGTPLGSLTFESAVSILEVRNLLVLGPLVLHSASRRQESIGAHFRGDTPHE